MRTERLADRVQSRLAGPRAPDEDDTEREESDTSLSRWLPDATTGRASSWLATVRADPGRAGVIGLGIVGAVAVLVTMFTLIRDDRPPVTSAKLPPVQIASSATPTAGPGQKPPPGPVVVSVVGLVHRPGLVTLDPGARIADALTAAGGPLDGADLVGLNMARRIDDGEQIVVGLSSPAGAPPAMGSSVAELPGAPPPARKSGEKPLATEALAGLVNLNTATLERLEALPGVGPVTAAAIIAWREANGTFAGVDQLGEVDGIGPARLEKLRALVEV